MGRQTEAANNLQRVAFGLRRFTNYRIRSLLYAGRLDIVGTIAPRQSKRI